MTAYSIAEVDTADWSGLQRYSDLAAPIIAAHDGRFLFAGTPQLAEGEWPEGRLIAVFEFPTMEQLRAWYDSPDYAEARTVGEAAFKRNLVFLDTATR